MPSLKTTSVIPDEIERLLVPDAIAAEMPPEDPHDVTLRQALVHWHFPHIVGKPSAKQTRMVRALFRSSRPR